MASSEESESGATDYESTETVKKKNNNKNLIQVSNNKKPFIFYLRLAQRYIRQYNHVELSGLGMAIPTVVTLSEILKRKGLAIQKNIITSSVDSTANDKGVLIQKAKIEIVLIKAEKPENTAVLTASEKAAVEA